MEGEDPRAGRASLNRALAEGVTAANDNPNMLRTILHPECPYLKGQESRHRQTWFDGFYSRQIQLNAGSILTKYGEPYEL